MIIPNEKEFVEQLLISKSKPKTMSVKCLIRYIAKYTYNMCLELSTTDYAYYVLGVVGTFNLPPQEYQEFKYAKYTRKYCSNLVNGIISPVLRNTTNIAFTEDEINRVNEAVYRKERKVLFTLYALAKIYSPTVGWVNISENDIFKCANVKASYSERIQILHSLYHNNLIDINHSIDKTGYKVEYFPNSPIAIQIKDMCDFGNQYLEYMTQVYYEKV